MPPTLLLLGLLCLAALHSSFSNAEEIDQITVYGDSGNLPLVGLTNQTTVLDSNEIATQRGKELAALYCSACRPI